jgi:hypothetical protein
LPVVLGIFRPVEARSKEIQSVTGCAGDQIGRLAAAKGWSASRGLHQGTPLSSSSATFAAVVPSCRRGWCPQPGDQQQDVAEHLSRHRDLSQLKRDIAPVVDDLRADLDQLLLEAGQRRIRLVAATANVSLLAVAAHKG